MIYQMILLPSSWHDQRPTTKLNLKCSYITDSVALVCIATTYFWVDQDKISNSQIWDQNSKPHPAALLTWQSESLKSAFNQGRSWQKNDEIDNWHAATVVSTLLLLLVSNIWRIMARWCVQVIKVHNRHFLFSSPTLNQFCHYFRKAHKTIYSITYQ